MLSRWNGAPLRNDRIAASGRSPSHTSPATRFGDTDRTQPDHDGPQAEESSNFVLGLWLQTAGRCARNSRSVPSSPCLSSGV
jgi:hypothetical protein